MDDTLRITLHRSFEEPLRQHVAVARQRRPRGRLLLRERGIELVEESDRKSVV